MSIKLTDREAQVMEILWRRGPSTVSEVREELTDALAYTTVLTILRTLEAKEYVRHEPEGRTHRYTALIDVDVARRNAARALVEKLFKGSTELLLTHLVTDDKLSDAELKRIKRLLEERSRKKE